MRKLILIIPFMLGYNTVQQPVVEPMVEINVKDVVVDVTPPLELNFSVKSVTSSPFRRVA